MFSEEVDLCTCLFPSVSYGVVVPLYVLILNWSVLYHVEGFRHHPQSQAGSWTRGPGLLDA